MELLNLLALRVTLDLQASAEQSLSRNLEVFAALRAVHDHRRALRQTLDVCSAELAADYLDQQIDAITFGRRQHLIRPIGFGVVDD